MAAPRRRAEPEKRPQSPAAMAGDMGGPFEEGGGVEGLYVWRSRGGDGRCARAGRVFSFDELVAVSWVFFALEDTKGVKARRTGGGFVLRAEWWLRLGRSCRGSATTVNSLCVRGGCGRLSVCNCVWGS